jgi:hypothetical protein
VDFCDEQWLMTAKAQKTEDGKVEPALRAGFRKET